jgi:hypothetical protein
MGKIRIRYRKGRKQLGVQLGQQQIFARHLKVKVVRKEFLRNKCMKVNWMIIGIRRNIDALSTFPSGLIYQVL